MIKNGSGYYIVTKEVLDQIKNDCVYPLSAGCDNCEYARPDEPNPCTFKGANALMIEVTHHPLSRELEKTRNATLMECRNIVGNKVIYGKCDELCDTCFLCDNAGGCIVAEPQRKAELKEMNRGK